MGKVAPGKINQTDGILLKRTSPTLREAPQEIAKISSSGARVKYNRGCPDLTCPCETSCHGVRRLGQPLDRVAEGRRLRGRPAAVGALLPPPRRSGADQGARRPPPAGRRWAAGRSTGSPGGRSCGPPQLVAVAGVDQEDLKPLAWSNSY